MDMTDEERGDPLSKGRGDHRGGMAPRPVLTDRLLGGWALLAGSLLWPFRRWVHFHTVPYEWTARAQEIVRRVP